MKRIACISDTHGKHKQVVIPEDIDMIIHAGDFSGSGQVWETEAFLKWFSALDVPHKVFISGNHDFMDQDHPQEFKKLLEQYPGVTYLRDEMIELDGIKIWGRPWTPEFYDWAFMADRGSPMMLSTLCVIPSGIDILLTHGPAYGILDKTIRGESVGCGDMLNELDRIKPKVVVFGHIHESAGQLEVNGIKHVNAAILNERYVNTNQPIIIELP